MRKPLSFFDTFFQNGLDGFAEYLFMSHHLEKGGSYELLKGYHRRDGIARQAEKEDIAYCAVDERPPRSHGHLPELQFASQFLHDVFDEVVITDGNTAGGNDDIGSPRPPKNNYQILAFIFGDSHLHGN